MIEEFPFQKAHDAIVSMLHDYLAEKEHAERLESENAILMERTALLMDEVERLKKFNEEAMAHIAKEERKSRERLEIAEAVIERLTNNISLATQRHLIASQYIKTLR